MKQVVIENPVINSPFGGPVRHFKFDDDGITDQIIEERRVSCYFVPIAHPRKKTKAKQETFDGWTADRIEENKLVNQIRQRVAVWRGRGYPNITRASHTIEHILPQTPKAEYWTSHFDADQRKKYTHDIGNLCLTLDNSSYGAKPFPEKKGAIGVPRCYANGDLLMERDLARFDDWTEKELLDRRATMMKWALIRWGFAPELEGNS